MLSTDRFPNRGAAIAAKSLSRLSRTAILIVLAGLGITYGNWLSLVALVTLPLGGFINRIRVEEAALLAALGDDHTVYASGRRRIVPFVWWGRAASNL